MLKHYNDDKVVSASLTVQWKPFKLSCMDVVIGHGKLTPYDSITNRTTTLPLNLQSLITAE